MRSFDDREKGFEAEFKRNQELAFRVTARRNRLFGAWAAEKLGLPVDQVEPYARTVVEADLSGVPRALCVQSSGQHRDEDEVVDAEHDLERGQRDERGPCIWVGQQRQHVHSAFLGQPDAEEI